MWVLLLSLFLGWGVYDASGPPKYDPANVFESTFSARMAEQLLPVLFPVEEPHVAGSPENAAMRDRITSQLTSFGYSPEVQARFHCKPDFGRCSPVENIVTLWEGASNEGAILLTAHYDSGWAGPGVSDDGVGVLAEFS